MFDDFGSVSAKKCGVRMSGLLAGTPGRKRRFGSMLEMLVWAYEGQRVHRAGVYRRGGAHRAGGVSSMARACEVAALGCVVDGGGVMRGFRVHPDAGALHELVLGLDEPGLVIGSAVAGGAPEWRVLDGPCRIVPVLRDNGRPWMVRDARSHRAVACQVASVGLLPEQRARLEVQLRERWLLWAAQVALLFERVRRRGEFSLWVVERAGVGDVPWMEKDSSCARKGVDFAQNV